MTYSFFLFSRVKRSFGGFLHLLTLATLGAVFCEVKKKRRSHDIHYIVLYQQLVFFALHYIQWFSTVAWLRPMWGKSRTRRKQDYQQTNQNVKEKIGNDAKKERSLISTPYPTPTYLPSCHYTHHIVRENLTLSETVWNVLKSARLARKKTFVF